MLVTIGIPTLSRFDLLREAVASALAQSHEPIEVLVSDDGQNSDIASWCSHLASSESRLRYIRTLGKVGLAANWNNVVRQAKGTYTIIIGDDDRLLPHFVERLLRLGSGADVIFCNQHLIDATGGRLAAESLAATATYGRLNLAPGQVDNPERVVWLNAIPMSAALILTRRLIADPFKVDLNTPELLFFAQLANQKGTFAFVPDYLAEYRVHAASATSNGLTLAQLATYLETVPVSRENKLLKKNRISTLMVEAASLSLSSGRTSEARRIVRSRLYPSWLTLCTRVLGQVTCAHLPTRWAAKAYSHRPRRAPQGSSKR